MDIILYTIPLIPCINDDIYKNTSFLTSFIPESDIIEKYIDSKNENEKYDINENELNNIFKKQYINIDKEGYYKSLHIACYNKLVNNISDIIRKMIFYGKKKYVYRTSVEFNSNIIDSVAWSINSEKNVNKDILQIWQNMGLKMPANILIENIKHKGYILDIKCNYTHPNDVDMYYPYTESIEVYDIYIKCDRKRKREEIDHKDPQC